MQTETIMKTNEMIMIMIIKQEQETNIRDRYGGIKLLDVYHSQLN